MAVDVYPAKSPSLGTSPRISFSHDLIQNCRSNDDPSLLDPTFDFDFSTGETFAFELSLADEIFSNGIILPAQIKPKIQTSEPKKPTNNNNKKIMRLKEFLSSNNDDTDQEEEEREEKVPFWKFRRSSSLNYNHGKGLIRPLQFFSRSKSTGSAAAAVQTPVSKDRRKQPLMFHRSSSCNSYYPYYNNSSKRPPTLKKSFSRSYVDSGIRVSPVLHFSHACIAKGTAGIRSFFCNGFGNGKSRGKIRK